MTIGKTVIRIAFLFCFYCCSNWDEMVKEKKSLSETREVKESERKGD